MIKTKSILARLMIILALAALPWAANAADQRYQDNGIITAKVSNKVIAINEMEYQVSPRIKVIGEGSRSLVLSDLKKGDFVAYRVVVLYGKHWIEAIARSKMPPS